MLIATDFKRNVDAFIKRAQNEVSIANDKMAEAIREYTRERTRKEKLENETSRLKKILDNEMSLKNEAQRSYAQERQKANTLADKLDRLRKDYEKLVEERKDLSSSLERLENEHADTKATQIETSAKTVKLEKLTDKLKADVNTATVEFRKYADELKVASDLRLLCKQIAVGKIKPADAYYTLTKTLTKLGIKY